MYTWAAIRAIYSVQAGIGFRRQLSSRGPTSGDYRPLTPQNIQQQQQQQYGSREQLSGVTAVDMNNDLPKQRASRAFAVAEIQWRPKR